MGRLGGVLSEGGTRSDSWFKKITHANIETEAFAVAQDTHPEAHA